MKLSLFRMSNGTIATLSRNFLSLKDTYDFFGGETVFVKQLAIDTPFQAVVDKARTSGLGNDVVAADDKRDRRFTALKKTIQAYHAREGYAHAAEVAMLMKAYDQLPKGITTMSYEDETTALREFFKRMNTPENQAALTKTALLPDYDALVQANAEFEALYNTAKQQDGSIIAQGSASALRRALIKRITRTYEWAEDAQDLSEAHRQLYAAMREHIIKAQNNSGGDNPSTPPAPPAG